MFVYHCHSGDCFFYKKEDLTCGALVHVVSVDEETTHELHDFCRVSREELRVVLAHAGAKVVGHSHGLSRPDGVTGDGSLEQKVERSFFRLVAMLFHSAWKAITVLWKGGK